MFNSYTFSIYVLLSLASCTVVQAQQIAAEEHRQEVHSILRENFENLHQGTIREIDSLKGNKGTADPVSMDEVFLYRRIHNLDTAVPMGYNAKIKEYIDKYTSRNYSPYLSKLYALSRYYFPIYDEIFEKKGIPAEVKFLSLIESSLDPHLVSRSGAVGFWQFMYPTAKGYQLVMDQYTDERKDPYLSCQAASIFLHEAFVEFDDWLVALASYNCGRGAMRRVIQRSGLERPTFWEIEHLLPQETRNYIPKFIAMVYVMNEAERYGLTDLELPEFNYTFKTLSVDRHVSLEQVAQALQLSTEDLKRYNPAYKKHLVRGTQEKPMRLIVPETEGRNDSLLYLALNQDVVLPSSTMERAPEEKMVAQLRAYKVQRGETLAMVAQKTGVSQQQLKQWNNINSRTALVGKTLRLQPSSAKASAKPAAQFVTYTIKKGDTLSGIASKYKGVSVTQLRKDNNIVGAHLKIGLSIKVRKGA